MIIYPDLFTALSDIGWFKELIFVAVCFVYSFYNNSLETTLRFPDIE